MDKRVKKEWIKALKSERYRQCTGALTDGEGFCCLGVLCNIHALETNTMWERQISTAGPIEVKGWIGYLGAGGGLPIEVKQWAGLSENNPTVGTSDLITLNDCEGENFKQIAKAIETHL